MKKIMAVQMLVAVIVLLSAGSGASAGADLPKSGSFSINSIVKGGVPIKFNDDYSHYTVSGVTFNETGSGLLHMGKVACAYANFTRKEINKGVGFCTYEDKDGDNIFVQYAGIATGPGEVNGTNEIIGGTGKFEGIRGGGAYACSHTDQKGEFPCTNKFDYQLPE